jgi:hypothetical protein
MQLTPEEFLVWKKAEVTEAVFDLLKQRIDSAIFELVRDAGKDSQRDRYMVGYITAMRDVLNTSFEDTQEEV